MFKAGHICRAVNIVDIRVSVRNCFKAEHLVRF